ncbi:GNVR domain-containing protein [Congregibacter variabilis]|uniref:GNVR domain-containing protein n=1 Tax=Congregibacter variabilis TaxID=3081200 RepID=UPI00388FF2C9
MLRIGQKACPPTYPIQPRRALIVAAATMAGGMFAVLLALILNAVEARRKVDSEDV